MADMMDDEVVIPEARNNDLLLGHEDVEAEFISMFQSGRMPHAWLITGPRGIGKATLAYRFARYVLKESKKSIEAPDLNAGGASLFGDLPSPEPEEASQQTNSLLYVAPDDPVFKRMSAMSHADFLGIERQWKDDKKIDRKTTIAVDDVRKVGGFMRMTPAEGGWRVVVVDAADEMNANAANALLKVLEEPPARCLLLLVSHSPGKLLPTIRSRCRKIALKPLEPDIMSDLLARYAPDLSAKDLSILSRLSDGSIGRAIELAEEGGLEVHHDITVLLRELPHMDAMKIHKLGDKLAKKGAEPAFRATKDLLSWIISRVVKAAAIQNASSAVDTMAMDQDMELISQLSKLATLDRWLSVWENIPSLLDRVEGANLDRKQVILNVFYELGQTVSR